MAGRGRVATLPAWMTAGDGLANNSALANANQKSIDYSSNQFQDAPPVRNPERRESSRDHRDVREQPPTRGGDGHREDKSDRRAKRSRSRSRERERPPERPHGRERRAPSPARERTSSNWKPRKKSSTNFDLKPTDGVELPPIGVITPVNGVPNSYFSFTNNPLGIMKDSAEVTAQPVDTSLHTRHARRVYAGGIPPSATEQEMVVFFNDVLLKALPAGTCTSPPALKAYINMEKCYAFVEMTSMELATACMELDGIRFEHYTGSHVLRIRRPNDYRPELVPKLGPIPRLNMELLASLGATGAATGGKIFIGGIPYGITDEQVVELLSAFGPVKSFNQIRDGSTNLTKGYGFCEYFSTEVADTAILGLNGMPLRDKVLTVRYAAQNNNNTNNMGGGNMPGSMQLSTSLGITNSTNNPYTHTYVTLPAPSFNFQHSSVMAQNTLTQSVASRVLKLSNMVTHEDLCQDEEYEEIKEDVRLECLEHGQVLSLIIPRLRDGYPASTEGHIYVEFAATDAAKAAAMALNGRKFADRTVVVQYFDELKYASRMFI